MTPVTSPGAGAEQAPPDVEGEALIVADGLVHRYGALTALGGLSLEVRPGQMVGLLGPDGAGKTTAIRIFAGMIAPTAGHVRVLGQNPLSPDPTLRSAVGYMPQKYSLYGDLSVEENLRFFSRMFLLSRAVYRQRRDRLLDITRLGQFTDRRADALSGGMYKKLALACALLPRPRLLLMDEPTNGVDPVSRRELWALLFELSAEGMAILVSTPYMDEAARCHRVGLVHQGRMVLQGAPSALIEGFSEVVYTLTAPDRDQAERALSDHPAVITTSAAGDGLRVVARRAQARALQHTARQLGGQLAEARPDFEDLFLAATEGARG